MTSHPLLRSSSVDEELICVPAPPYADPSFYAPNLRDVMASLLQKASVLIATKDRQVSFV